MNSQTSKPLVLLTGASGLIGSHTANRLATSYTVVGLDRPGAPHPPPSAYNIPVDLTSTESVRSGLRTVAERYRGRVASVIHLAAYFDFSGEASSKYQEVTVEGTRRLLRALHESKFDVEQFVFSSTMLVHAPCEPGQVIHEEWPLDPRWPYPQSKVETERLIDEERGTIPTVSLRIAGVYDDFCHSIPLANQIERIHERHVTSKLFPGHISHGQSFVHVEDLVDAIERTVDRRRTLASDAVMLIGEPEPVSYDELQHRFGRLLHDEEWETVQIPKALAKTGAWMQDAMPFIEDPFIKAWMIDFADDHYALDIARAKAWLEWQPRRTLRDTIPKMICALKQDPLAWYRAHKLSPSPELSQQET